jgi:hypothetical protein
MLEDVGALLLGQIDIEDHQSGTRRPSIGIGLVKEVRGLLTVFGNVNVRVDARCFDGLTDQKQVGRIVLDDEDSDGSRRVRVIRREA